ncbi:heavy-metal-associated domain-containing protein [Helicobacter sp. MIT 14-3879]|uniref:heavy-metal-associated domain-containing protein n=1 Tax=Helicobacter sp. MIT 14-3879 TaxID=2040649 RepID=UPI000E1ED18B|nr:copper ion binding protein [Helicobacter sp. MIT 14-3879]RDU64700.1 hypothetical protein CQA44_03015 [Helicobacter sp. MIT 14-3879]
MREIIEIEGMSCNHCVEKIKKFVSEVNGVENIEISLENKTLDVVFNLPANIEAIKEAILDSGFDIKA